MQAPPRQAASAASHSHQALNAFAGAGADQHPIDSGVDLVEVVEEPVEVVVEMWEQVDLVDQHQIAGAEHQRVLEWLVLALGDRARPSPARPRRP